MIYFDNAATTSISYEVLAAMKPYLMDFYGNPGSKHHLGITAKQAIFKAKKQVSDLISADENQILFTGTGSEANSIAIVGLADYLRSIGKMKIITDKAEHLSVLESCRHMERLGFEVVYLDVDYGGRVIIEDLENAIDGNTGLVAIMYSNNELGSVNDVKRISDICQRHEALFHCDCIQAALGYEIDFSLFDSCSISGHKIHAPKGVGALALKDKTLYNCITFGGEQEYGLRPGTENVPAIAGFGKAAEIALANREKIISKTTALADRFAVNVLKLDGVSVFIERPNTKLVSVTVDGVDAMSLVLALGNKGVAVSAGAACSSHDVSPTHVLTAAGRSAKEAASTIRVSFSEVNTEREVDGAIKVFAEQLTRLRNFGKANVNDEQQETQESQRGDIPP